MIFKVPVPINEPVKQYAANSDERRLLKAQLSDFQAQTFDIPMFIGGKEIRTNATKAIVCPHNHQHILGNYHQGDASHVQAAIEASLRAKTQWENLSWEHRASIFLKMAELLATKYRYILNAATMLGQSKNAFQAEIDAACEMIDFLRFNVQYLTEIYQNQPAANTQGIWNRLEYRALEGFIFALTPFNFTAIAGNLPTAPAMMGNVVVWKPAETQIFSAYWLMKLYQEAGLPDGVINLVYVSGPTAGGVIFKDKAFAGIHFTGSTGVFNRIWQDIATNINEYKSYPRIVGETGGKDFVMVHRSAMVDVVVTALVRGAFEYQGQKCSAASRAYIPSNLWEEVKTKLVNEIKTMKMGDVNDFSNFINAVISEKSFDEIANYINEAKNSIDAEIIVGGKCDKSIGYFIEPTVVVSKNPKYTTMCEEIFGPVLSIYVYEESDFEATLDLLNDTSKYALTGAIICQDRYAIDLATQKLRHAAGNFYINDKPTGAVVGQQPFGGARASGTNDKAGSVYNLLRWVSIRTIKETFVPATTYQYPFLENEQ